MSIFIYTGPSFDFSVAYKGKATVGLQLTLGGDWGLTNLVKDYNGTKLNKPFSISLQYLF